MVGEIAVQTQRMLQSGQSVTLLDEVGGVGRSAHIVDRLGTGIGKRGSGQFGFKTDNPAAQSCQLPGRSQSTRSRAHHHGVGDR
jgi:hypothetical protein